MDFDLDDKDEDMESEDDDQDANEKIAENTKIVEAENTKPTNDKVESGKIDIESKDKEYWTKEEMKLVVVLWNNLDPTQITHLKGRWYHMYSRQHALLRDPNNDFTAAVVKANKG